MKKKPAIYSFIPERNRHTAAGEHGKVTVYRLSEMSDSEIKEHGLQRYVEREVIENE